MGIESELKLTIALSDLHRIGRQVWLRKLASGTVRREKLVSAYFDTPSFKLHNHGISLRIRKQGRKRLQTIKAGPDGRNGAFSRREWEAEISSDMPNYKLAKDTALGPLLTPKLKRTLRPMFETNIERTILPVKVGASFIEVALDQGHIQTTRCRERVSEIELELKTGERADLVRLGQRFLRNLPVSYGVLAKADRGYALSADTRGKPVEASDIVLVPNASVAEAFTVIGLACLTHLASNAEAVLHCSSEGVHQMRVGVRRLRAAISVFKNVNRGPETEKVKSELKWLTEQLGPARDFDVLIGESVTPLQKADPNNSEMALLKSDLMKQRHSGFDRAKSVVKNDRYRRVVLQTALWLANGNWLRNPQTATRRARRIDVYAVSVLDSWTRKIIKKVARLDSLDARNRHKLRIATKKLRYATDFFDAVLQHNGTKDQRKEFKKSLTELQNALGILNDIAVHVALARKYAHPTPSGRNQPAKAFAMGLLAGQEQTKAKACMAAAMKAGKRLRKAPLYWT